MKALKKLSFTGSGKWISPPNKIMGRKSADVIQPSRTKWTRRVPHPVLTEHASSLSQVIQYLHRYHAALTTHALDLSHQGLEYLHADICCLTELVPSASSPPEVGVPRLRRAGRTNPYLI